MFLYLVQHGEAKKKEEDPARPLSETGLKNIGKTSSYLSGLNVKIDEIFHSGKLRANQTAEVLAEALKPEKGLSKTDGIAPMDDPAIWAERLKGINNNIILVGHLPHLSKLASLLLCGDADKTIVEFKMAGVVCLRKCDAEEWSLHWMLIPEIIN